MTWASMTRSDISPRSHRSATPTGRPSRGETRKRCSGCRYEAPAREPSAYAGLLRLALIDLNVGSGEEVDPGPPGLFWLPGNGSSLDELRLVDGVSEMTFWASCARQVGLPLRCPCVRLRQTASRRRKILTQIFTDYRSGPHYLE